MHHALKTVMPALLAGLTLGGCAKAGGLAATQTQEANQSGSSPAASAPVQPTPAPSPAPDAAPLPPPGLTSTECLSLIRNWASSPTSG